jgi:hypothetical protein
MSSLTLHLVPGDFAVCRLAPNEPVPTWAGSPVFSSVTRTAEELSIACPAAPVPSAIKAERDWRLLKIAGPFAFDAIGILAAVTEPLGRAGISLLAIATFDTDYVLIKAARLDDAIRVLEAAGHNVRRS